MLGQVTSLSLYAFASRAFGSWDQRPVFKSHVVQPSVLRRCQPWVDVSLLRRLPDYFPAVDARIGITPAHEGEGRSLSPGTVGTPEQRAFDDFKRLRNAGLLGTDGDRDLYFVALESGGVFETCPGRHFWRLAKDDRL